MSRSCLSMASLEITGLTLHDMAKWREEFKEREREREREKDTAPQQKYFFSKRDGALENIDRF